MRSDHEAVKAALTESMQAMFRAMLSAERTGNTLYADAIAAIGTAAEVAVKLSDAEAYQSAYMERSHD